MKTRKRNRLMALALCLCMMVTMLPMTGMTFAAEPCPNHAAHDDTCGFVQTVKGHECGHTHDNKCGYTEAKEGMSCKHEQGEHDESCGYAPPSEEAPCGHTHDESCGEPDENGQYPGCAHEHKVNDSEAGREGPLGGDDGCGYAPAGEGAPCAHTNHDGDCGYVEAKEGATCQHVHDADCGYIEAVEGKPCGHTCELCDESEAANALPLGEELIEQSKTVVISDYDKDCDFSLKSGNAPGSYSISGNVMLRGAYWEGLSIEVTLWQDGKQVGSVMSEDDSVGTYSFSSLAPGTYTVKAGGWSGGVYYTEQSQTVTITNGNARCGFDLEPGNAPGTYSISGRVTLLGALSGISGIPVELWQDGKKISETKTVLEVIGISHSINKFSLVNILPGNYTLRMPAGVYGGTYYLESTNTLTLENDITSIMLELKPGTAPGGYVVSGTIQDDKGVGCQGVPVQLLNADVKMFETTTGTNGGYTFPKVSDAVYTLKIPAGTYGGIAYLETSKGITVSGQNLSVGTLKLTAAATVPTVPQNFQATPGIGQVELTWTAPASNGGAEITKYEVSKDDGANWTTASSATDHTFTNLTGGQSYTFQVRAVNKAGAGAAAETSATTLPTEPGVPRDLTASPGNGEVTLTWKTPESDGGAQITKYYYSANNGNSPITPIVSIPDSDAGTTSYTVTGLENDTEYTFKVWAYNSAGHGEEASVKATPKSSPPGSPQGLTPSVGDGQVTLSWTAPASDGGAPITKYQYQYQEGRTSIRPPQWQDIPGSGASTTSHTITGLKNDQSYTIKVRAVNRAGEGEEASIAIHPCKGTVKTKDGAPLSGIQVTVWQGSIQVGRTLVTDETGSFSTHIAQGSYTVKAGGLADDGVHYAEQSQTAIVLLPTSVDFNLEPVVESALSFTDSDSYDIPASTVGTAIAEIDVSGGVSGGKEPYAFTADGLPAGISISEAGIIYGTPTAEKEAGTATITVTDSGNTRKEITINYGEITKPATKQVAAPVFSPAGGTYDSPQSVEITCATEGAEIHYTTDGSAPTADSTRYTGAIGVSETTTIKAIAVKDGMTDSAVAEATYTIQITPAHTHSWADAWTDNDSYHWHECTTDDCLIVENSEKDGYGAHTESDWITTKQPTETEAGSRKKECTVCKRELVTEEIPMLDPGHVHSLTYIQAKAATCVEDGHTEYYYCKGCGKYFSDNAGTTEIELSSTVIPATGIHTVGDGWQHDGENHWKRCSVCNQEVEKTAHSGGTANCHQKAVCETCGAEYGSLNPANHDGKTEIRGKKDATETEDGYTGDTYCLGCGAKIKTGTVIPATGHTHSYTGEWQSDGDGHWKLCDVCGEPGEKTAHSGGTANCHQKADCETCGAKYGSLNPADHDGKTEVRDKKDATETEEGYTGNTYCLGCGELIKKGEVIPKKEPGHTHEFGGEWKSDAENHWQLCTAGDGEVGNKAAHTASGWIEDKNLSENELSKRHQECTVCSYRMATVIIVKSDGIVEVTPGKDSNWTFYGDFKDLKAIKLNSVPMGIEPQSETSANLTYPGYEGIAGIAKAGSVEVTLYADFLKTLPAGAYTLEAEFASGKTTSIGSTEFTVSNDSKPEPKPDPNDPAPDKKPTPGKEPTQDSKPTPDTKPASPADAAATGDTSRLWPWILLMLAAVTGGTVLAYWRIRNKKRHR